MYHTTLLLISLLFSSVSLAQIGIDFTATTFPTDDGHDMAIDYYLSGDSSAKPTILIQTPYNRKAYRFGLLPLVGLNFANSDYHVVIADWRGFYDNSSVPITQGFDRGLDGVDCIEWIRQQPWSNDTVVTYGGSALGVIQYQTARHQPEGLVAICPLVAYPGTFYQSYYHGGVLLQENLNTIDALGYGIGGIISSNFVYNFLWQSTEQANWYLDEIEVPVFSIGGWYDHNVELQVRFFDSLRVAGAPGVRDEHKLLVGPWTHGNLDASGGPGAISQGELEHPNAAFRNFTMALQFFNYYALGEQNGWDTVSTYTTFAIGSETWNYGDGWHTNTTDKSLYLHPSNLRMDEQMPSLDTTLSFVVDPTAPSPSIGGQTFSDDLARGPVDISASIETRTDGIVFTTTAFSDTLRIRGKIATELYLQVDRPDADVAVRLTMVYPDGRSMIMAQDIQRLRFLNGNRATDTALITPGETQLVTLELPPLSLDLPPDHQLRLIISGNNAPHYDLNLQNGGELYTAGDSLVATHTYLFGPTQAARLVLPVLNPEVTTSRSSFNLATALQLWPNPSRGELHVQLPRDWQNAELEVFNLSGQRVYQHSISSNKAIIQLDQPTGVYLVRVTHHSQQHSQRIVLSD